MSNTEEKTYPLIYGKMIAIMKDVEPVGKNQQNTAQKYAFRGIDDIYNALHNLMGKHGVFSMTTAMPDTLIREQHPTKSGGVQFLTIQDFKFTFYAEDGSSVETVTKGEAMDFGDKSCNKAMSAAHKYALVQAFTLETKENADTEFQSPEVIQEPLATSDDLAIYNKARLQAVQMGFLTGSGKEPKLLTESDTKADAIKRTHALQTWIDANTPAESETDAAMGDDGSTEIPPLCDSAKYSKVYFAAADGTAYKEAAGRASFIKDHTQGAFDSLSTFLNQATEPEARKLIDALKTQINLDKGEMDESDPFAAEPTVAEVKKQRSHSSDNETSMASDMAFSYMEDYGEK